MSIFYPDNTASRTALPASGINDSALLLNVSYSGVERSLTLAELKKTDEKTINILQYGADSTGAQDSSTALQAAVNAAKGTSTKVIVPDGLYLLSSAITIDDDLELEIRGDINYAGSNVLFQCSGTPGGTYTLSTNYEQGTSSIVVTNASGLSIGDSLTINVPIDVGTVTSHCKIEGLSGTTITLDRGLSRNVLSASAIITKYSPKKISLLGKRSTINLSNNQPKFFEGQYLEDSEVSGFTLVFSGAESSASSTVNYTTRFANCLNCSFEKLSYRGLTGGGEFCHIASDYSDGTNIKNVIIVPKGGEVKTLESRYSTSAVIERVRIHGSYSDIGSIFIYCSYGCLIDKCDVLETAAATGGSTGAAGIQITSSEFITVSRCRVVNARGEGAIYVSGNGSNIIIENNNLSNTTTDSTNTYAMIALRSGSDISVTGNRIHCTKEIPSISVAGISNFAITGNSITGNNLGFYFDKRGSDPTTYAYFPKRGVVSGNNVLITNSSAFCSVCNFGSLSENITFSSNEVKMISQNISASSKWGVLVDGYNHFIKDNHFTLIFEIDPANTGVYPIQIAGKFNEFSENTIVYGSYVAPITNNHNRNLVGKNRIQRVLNVASQTASTDLVAVSGSHNLVSGDIVYFTPLDNGVLGSGISAGTAYYIKSSGITSSAFLISTTSPTGIAVDITSNSSGDILLYTSRLRLVYCTGTTLEYRDNEFFAATKRGTTGQRPTLTTDDAGFMYRDTTTASIVTWTGSAWE